MFTAFLSSLSQAYCVLLHFLSYFFISGMQEVGSWLFVFPSVRNAECCCPFAYFFLEADLIFVLAVCIHWKLFRKLRSFHKIYNQWNRKETSSLVIWLNFLLYKFKTKCHLPVTGPASKLSFMIQKNYFISWWDLCAFFSLPSDWSTDGRLPTTRSTASSSRLSWPGRLSWVSAHEKISCDSLFNEIARMCRVGIRFWAMLRIWT